MKYELTDAYLRFYFAFIRPNIQKLKTKGTGNLAERIMSSGAFHAWLGRSFEYVCRDHAVEISKILGFSGINFTCGPYFRPSRKGTPGVQIDLLFDRADQVITLCEMKYQNDKVGAAVIPEIAKRVSDLRKQFPNKNIQSLLVTANGVTKEVEASLVPSRTLLVDELF